MRNKNKGPQSLRRFDIRKFNLGDEKMLGLLYDYFYPMLYNKAMIVIGDGEEAKDIIIEKLMNLWKKRDNFTTVEEIESFLIVCVRNACYDHLRSYAVRNRQSEDILTDMPISPVAEKEMYDAFIAKTILDAVKQIPAAKCREIMQLNIDGLGQKEIADRLSISPKNVATQLLKGRKFLKRLLPPWLLSDIDKLLGIILIVKYIHTWQIASIF